MYVYLAMYMVKTLELIDMKNIILKRGQPKANGGTNAAPRPQKKPCHKQT